MTRPRAAGPHLVDVGFGIAAVLLLLGMWVMEGYETVPYHVLFVTFAVVYGFRTWPLPQTTAVLSVIIVVSGFVLVYRWRADVIPPDELFEIGLMPLILAAMVWHARRRAAMQHELELLAAQERERRLREHAFARDTSHAVRTPLTIARGHVELIREQVASAPVRADADVALQELDRIGRMASRLLAITELERPEALTIRAVDIAHLVRATHARWAVSVARDWQLCCPEVAWINGDEDVLRTALDALIENAVSFTGEGEVVRLFCDADGQSVLLGVADSGPGVSKDESALMFQRFWRSPTRRESTGLGLSYVRAAAEAHNGTVAVGRAPEGGALVGLRLPTSMVGDLSPMPDKDPPPQLASV